MIMKKEPLFSVIIPQKNRAEYLKWTIKTCMIQDYENFQIIVSDDCSDDDSVEVVRELAKKDSRIKLFAHEKHIGMRENFEFALNQVKEGYVIALGGDDGLVPGCISEMNKIIQETGMQLLTWPLARYNYPNPVDATSSSLFSVRRSKYDNVVILKSKDFLKKISKTFIYQIDESPMFYMKGVASIDLINRVKERTPDHSFYYCPTPDGFSGVVLAGEVEEYAFSPKPLSIAGTTFKSQGQNYRRIDKKSRDESKQFFEDNSRKTMHHLLASQPYSPLEPLMTADYLLTAADLNGWPGKCYDIDFKLLIKRCFKFLEKSYFHNDVLIRELKIIREIAKMHGLSDYYNTLLKKTKKKVIIMDKVQGFVITNSVRMEGESMGIHNIYDASLAVNIVYNFYKKFSYKLPLQAFIRAIKVVLRDKIRKSEPLPEID